MCTKMAPYKYSSFPFLSSPKAGEHFQWLSHDDSTVNIVAVLFTIIIITMVDRTTHTTVIR